MQYLLNRYNVLQSQNQTLKLSVDFTYLILKGNGLRMNKKVKQILSLLLVAVMLIVAIPMSTVPALAATNGHTQAEAIQWLNSKIGVTIGDGQCPALAREYYSYLGYSVSGNGKDYEKNVPSGWTRTYYYSGFVPQPGDIAVWRATNTEAGKIYGHVAIVQSATSSSMICYEQGSTALYKVRTHGYSYGMVTCFIRPDFNNAPSNVWISIPWGEESSYKVNSAVDISFGANNATQFNLQIYKGQQKYWYGEFYAPSGSTVCPASFDSVGHYSCYVTAVNSSGATAQSGWIGFDVVDNAPSDLTISLNNRNSFNVYNINDEVVFYLNAKYGYYKHIAIYKVDGTLFKESDVSGYTYSFSTDVSGAYYAYFDAMNACGSSRSEKVYFEIVSGVPSRTNIQIVAPTSSDYYVGDTLTFKLTADGANVISWGIHKGSSLVEWNYIESKTLKYKFNSPGEYHISIDAMNEYGTVRSDSYYFTIKDPRSYTVSYNTNGGTGSVASQTKQHDVNLTLSSSKPNGKVFTVSYNANGGSVSPASKSVSQKFVNWNTKADGSGKSYLSGATYSGNADLTLYAQYSNPSLGTLPTPTKSGYTFDDWYTAKDGGTKASESLKVSANITLYAHWTKLEQSVPSVKSVKIDDGAEINYKSSYKLSYEISAESGAEYTIKWESSNPKVAAVDKNGKVTALKKGSTEITCTVTDSNGNVVSDSCTVTVNYNFGQWLIIIVLFGWIWYI